MDAHCVAVMDATQMIIEIRQKKKGKYQRVEADKEIEKIVDPDLDLQDPQESHLLHK